VGQGFGTFRSRTRATRIHAPRRRQIAELVSEVLKSNATWINRKNEEAAIGWTIF